MTLRIVYDGALGAGTTSLVHRLHSHIPPTRQGRRVAPDWDGGATRFFDWVDFAGGVMDGWRVHCQVVTTPDGNRFAARRAFLLATADAVVFVADSHPLLTFEARDAFTSLCETLGGLSHPCDRVLVANKQDRENAVEPATLAERVGAGASAPCFPASARRNEGVRAPFVEAVRLAVARARRLRLASPSDGQRPLMQPEALHQALLPLEDAAVHG